MISKESFTSAGNRPKQARSQLYLERIVDSAVRFINEEGVDALTMTSLAQRSNLSIGGIYRRFTDKTELFQFLKDYYLTLFELEAAKAFERPTHRLSDVIDILFDLHISRIEGNERFWHFIVSPPGDDPVMRDRGKRTIEVMENVFGDAGMRHLAEIKHKDPQAALRTAFHFAFSILTMRLRFKSAVPTILAWRMLRLEGSRAILAYLSCLEAAAQLGHARK